MRTLNWQMKQLGERHVDGSYATQQGRARTLSMVANALYEMGFTHLTLAGIKPRHIEALVERWKSEELATGTLKNRMTHLRWLAEKIGKQNIVARTNDAYGIADRVYVTNVSKARELTAEQLSRITDPYCAIVLAIASGIRLAPRGKSQDSTGPGGSGRCAGIAGELVQGRSRA